MQAPPPANALELVAREKVLNYDRYNTGLLASYGVPCRKLIWSSYLVNLITGWLTSIYNVTEETQSPSSFQKISIGSISGHRITLREPFLETEKSLTNSCRKFLSPRLFRSFTNLHGTVPQACPHPTQEKSNPQRDLISPALPLARRYKTLPPHKEDSVAILKIPRKKRGGGGA